MDAAYRSTQSPYEAALPTQLVNDKFAHDFLTNKASKALEKDHVLAAALSEYCRLKEDGAVPPIDEFCRRYPTYHKSIQRLIDVEETLGKLDDFDDTEWPEVGSSFMGFDILHELGVGAFARVYLASEPALGGRLVAVKVAMYGSDEAETLGKLVHPNVVPVHSVRDDPDSGMTAVCMPYLGSATLSDVIEQVFQDGVPFKGSTILQAVARREIVGESATGLAASEPDKVFRRGSYVDAVVWLGIQMAEALVYTHAQGILHRDLKPSNVLITPGGQPKLLDFNLSCNVETEVNRLGGTLPYMPPEQIKDVFLCPLEAQPPTDPRSDIFSLGVILYELLTGELPFGIPPASLPPVEAGSVYLAAQQSPPRPLQELNPAIDSRTAQLIARCIAPNPAHRPANAELLVAELGRHFSWPRRIRRWPLANKKIVIAGAAVMFVMLLSLFWHLETRPTLDRRIYNRGLAAMANEDYRGAIVHFTEALKLNENEPSIRLARGICHRASHDHSAAYHDFKDIAKEDCDSIILEVYGYSILEAGTSDASEAVVPYGELVARHPEKLQLWLNLAFASSKLVLKQRPPSRAIRLADEILRRDPACQAAHHIRAICGYDYYKMNRSAGDLVDLLQDVETAIAMGPLNPDLEKKRIQLLAAIAEDEPHLREALIAETKPRLWQLAPHLEKGTLLPLVKTLKLTGDEQWVNAVSGRCRTTPERSAMSYIALPPSEAAIQQYLERAWN